MPEFAIVDLSGNAAVRGALPWISRALTIQMAEHFLPAYASFFDQLGIPAEFMPCSSYDSLSGLDPTKFDPCVVLPSVPEGELGSHNDALGIVTARALAQGADTSITLSHEYMEWRMDRTCALWVRQNDGSALAAEPCDAPESIDYAVEVDLLGIKRQIRVSNFVLPNWFVQGSRGPWDWVSSGRPEADWLLRGPGDVLPNCHAVRMAADGTVSTSYGRLTTSRGLADHAERFCNSLSRTSRRMRTAPRAIVRNPLGADYRI